MAALTLEQIKALKPNTKVRVRGFWFDDYAEQRHATERICILWERTVRALTEAVFPLTEECSLIGTVLGKDGEKLEEFMDVHEVLAVVEEA